MFSKLFWVTLIYCFNKTSGLVCFNCSSVSRVWNECAGDFVYPPRIFNNTRNYLTNCTGENSMCFVRSWTARSQYAWTVQRGCYETFKGDPLPGSMIIPTRAMTCKHEKLADAEYKVCLCKADWCNSAATLHHHQYLPMITTIYSSSLTLHIFLISALLLCTRIN